MILPVAPASAFIIFFACKVFELRAVNAIANTAYAISFLKEIIMFPHKYSWQITRAISDLDSSPKREEKANRLSLLDPSFDGQGGYDLSSFKLLALFFSTQLENLVAFAFLIKGKGECHKISKVEIFFQYIQIVIILF